MLCSAWENDVVDSVISLKSKQEFEEPKAPLRDNSGEAPNVNPHALQLRSLCAAHGLHYVNAIIHGDHQVGVVAGSEARDRQGGVAGVTYSRSQGVCLVLNVEVGGHVSTFSTQFLRQR